MPVPCGLKVEHCDSVCSMDEWLKCSDKKIIPQHIKDKLKKQKRNKG